jgi:putative SOS response-associated peptidase YedK
MCGRFAQVFQTQDLEQIERIMTQALGVDDSLIELWAANHQPTHNACPTQYATVLHQPSSGRIGATQAHFGLIPSWSKNRDRAGSMINARSETLSAKPAFRDLYRSRRCLIPISGFYEWQKVPGTPTKQSAKQPWYIRRADEHPMLIAGLWDTWLDPAHGHCEVDSFTIITTNANEFIADKHHRMPVILEPESISTWFDRTAEPRTLTTLLSPSPEGILSAHRVSTRVNSPKNNDLTLIEPTETDPGFDTLWAQ